MGSERRGRLKCERCAPGCGCQQVVTATALWQIPTVVDLCECSVTSHRSVTVGDPDTPKTGPFWTEVPRHEELSASGPSSAIPGVRGKHRSRKKLIENRRHGVVSQE